MDNRFYMRVLGIAGLFIGLLIVIRLPPKGPSGEVAVRNANNTRTAIALTERVLMGPFPTATGPTATASKTPTITPTATLTFTSTPSPTPFRYFISTATPRTAIPNDKTAIPVTNTPISPFHPTNTSAQATNPPPPTNPPPTDPPPTDPLPTNPPPPPIPPTPCLNPQGHPIPCH